MRFGRAVAAGMLLMVLVPAVPAQARAQAVCPQQPATYPVSAKRPYEDDLLTPERLSPFATGRGVRVAVIDSGVDATHPQLDGKVAAGRDFLHGNPDARQDCVGHGTGVASIIAAEPVTGSGLRGLAPGATIVPVRISEAVDDGTGVSTGTETAPGKFAEAIRWAASPSGGNADVINMSLVMPGDDPAVRSAVAAAAGDGVIVVAAAGNKGRADDGNPTAYPAAYPGVIGVAAVDGTGTRGDFSQYGAWVDIAAPGVGVTMAAVGGGHRVDQGTSFATPYVSATAALILQRFPTLTPAQVQRRLLATADPAPGGATSAQYGFGVLNPYRAVTESLGLQTTPAPAPAIVHTPDPAQVAAERRSASARTLSVLIAGGGALLVLVVIIGGLAIRRGRRRGWRAASD
jgi:membrane-anchored mycosin MYCP